MHLMLLRKNGLDYIDDFYTQHTKTQYTGSQYSLQLLYVMIVEHETECDTK